jgi:negative regulator of flagellin synthesis FlgM
MNIHSNLNLIAPLQQDGSTPTSNSRIGNTSAGEAKAAQIPPAAPAVTTLGDDQTHLSQAAVAASATSHDSDVRPEKVAAIQQALANGSYAVSPSDVAGKLIDHLLEK